MRVRRPVLRRRLWPASSLSKRRLRCVLRPTPALPRLRHHYIVGFQERATTPFNITAAQNASHSHYYLQRFNILVRVFLRHKYQNAILFTPCTLSVHQCEPKYCDKKCEYGYVSDSYGCETCECVDPCLDVHCGKNEVCVKGTCGKEPLTQMTYCNSANVNQN